MVANDYGEIYEALSTLKNKKLEKNYILIEKYKDIILYPDIEQNYVRITVEAIYKIGHDSIRLMKWLA